ncbi:MAG: type II secretion system protein [Patescibacteria group bacterium]
MKNFKKGFTLIELLVVVAIIAILSSVVLVTLGTAKNKGADAAVKSNLNTIRSLSELFYSNNGNSFLPSGGSTFAIAVCPSYNVAGTNMMSKDKVIADAIAEATNRGGNGNRCYNSTSAWAVAVGLKTSATTSWCIDSSGMGKQVSSAPASAINGTTFLCN